MHNVSHKAQSSFATKLEYRYSAIRRNTMPCLLSKQLSSATNDPLGSQSTSDQSRRNIMPSLRAPLVENIYVQLLSSFQKVSGLTVAITKLSLVRVSSEEFALCAVTYWYAFVSSCVLSSLNYVPHHFGD